MNLSGMVTSLSTTVSLTELEVSLLDVCSLEILIHCLDFMLQHILDPNIAKYTHIQHISSLEKPL